MLLLQLLGAINVPLYGEGPYPPSTVYGHATMVQFSEYALSLPHHDIFGVISYF